jgi:acetyltransferase-like isoleucine patch superfamily enzyme
LAVFDLRTYDSIASDVVRRWTYPFTIDSNFLSFGSSDFTCSRGNRYKDGNVRVGANTTIGPNTVLGSGMEVGDSVNIHLSTFGSGCVVEEGVTVNGSHAWKNVRIGAGATVDRALLCDGVIVGRNATVGRGCVLSFGVVIGDNVVVPEFTSLTRVPRKLVQRRVRVLEGWDDEYDDEVEGVSGGGSGGGAGGGGGDSGQCGEATEREFNWNSFLASMIPETDVEVVGPGGVGRVWDPNEEEVRNFSLFIPIFFILLTSNYRFGSTFSIGKIL